MAYYTKKVLSTEEMQQAESFVLTLFATMLNLTKDEPGSCMVSMHSDMPGSLWGLYVSHPHHPYGVLNIQMNQDDSVGAQIRELLVEELANGCVEHIEQGVSLSGGLRMNLERQVEHQVLGSKCPGYIQNTQYGVPLDIGTLLQFMDQNSGN